MTTRAITLGCSVRCSGGPGNPFPRTGDGQYFRNSSNNVRFDPPLEFELDELFEFELDELFELELDELFELELDELLELELDELLELELDEPFELELEELLPANCSNFSSVA